MPEENRVGQRVLEIVKAKGPVIPTDISKEIGTNSILASAILSEQVSNNQLRISNVKVGGTPLYYAPGQEDKLQNYTKYLHEKEKKAYDMLKTELVLRDRVLEPVTRVALRQIKDFAHPLNVQTQEEVELFWKWYLLTNEEAEPVIGRLLKVGSESEKAPVVDKQEQLSHTPIANQLIESVVEKPALKPKRTVTKPAGDIDKKALTYFKDNQIEVMETFESKRKSEAEFIISVPTPVGSIKYYCKTKDKKTCNEGDLSTAFVQGQSRKLPVLFITTGRLTKLATQMLEKEFSSIKVKII